tara:strand:- start:295 stop:720 length:426 start_codon:yes stop_codon:yes gene_type:complete
MGYIEELLRKLLGGDKPVSAITRDLTEGSYRGDPRSRTGVQTRPAQKSSKMSQETLEGFKELRYDLEAAADRNIRKARKSVEGVDFADVKMPQPGLAVEAYAPVSNLGLMPSITGGSKEQRGWQARKDDDLWSLLSRGLGR